MALDVAKILSELKAQRQDLEAAIATLERRTPRRASRKQRKSPGGPPPNPELPPAAGGAAQVACTFGTTRFRRATPKEPS